MSKEKIEPLDPTTYCMNDPLHIAIYGYNGSGKTTFAGRSGLRTVILDCGDAGIVTLRDVKEGLKVIKIRSINHYLDVIGYVIDRASQIDLLVPDTLTGLQAIAIKEVKKKGVRDFDMNQKKWGGVGARLIECISETRNFPKDVIYLVQEKNKRGSDNEANEITPSLTPSIRGYLSSCVDWVGNLSVDGEGKRFMDFRLTDHLEVKDRANLFPKLIANPTYLGIRKRITSQLEGNKNAESKQ